jgi:hypothetical protein
MRYRVFGSRHFETTQFSHLQVPKCPKKNSGTFRHLKMWPLYCFETSGNRIPGESVLCPITTVALFLGAFAKLPKAPVSFVMSVRPSICVEQFGSHWTNIHEIWWLIIFENLSRKFQLNWTLSRITGTLHADQYTVMIISLSVILRTRNVSEKSCRENQKTHFMFNNFFLKCHLWDNMGKYCGGGESTDDNMAHAHCMMDA